VLLARPAIASSVNFTYLPMPDAVNNGNDCRVADDVEACALHATKCTHGCTGGAAASLASFLACYESSFTEMHCSKSATADRGCVASAGVDKSSYAQCRADKALTRQIQTDVASRGAGVHSFPKVTIGGKDASNEAQSQKTLLAALCQGGVSPAC